MKPNFTLASTLVLIGATLFLAACGKNESVPAPKSEASAPANAANAAVGEVKKQVEEVKGAVESKAKEVAAQANSQAQALIDQAKSLISQNKFSEALTSVNQLSSFKLSPDQQQLVEKLKEQIQKALAGQGAAKSIGNLIPGAK